MGVTAPYESTVLTGADQPSSQGTSTSPGTGTGTSPGTGPAGRPLLMAGLGAATISSSAVFVTLSGAGALSTPL
jgi:hypothetical protein